MYNSSIQHIVLLLKRKYGTIYIRNSGSMDGIMML